MFFVLAKNYYFSVQGAKFSVDSGTIAPVFLLQIHEGQFAHHHWLQWVELQGFLQVRNAGVKLTETQFKFSSIENQISKPLFSYRSAVPSVFAPWHSFPRTVAKPFRNKWLRRSRRPTCSTTWQRVLSRFQLWPLPQPTKLILMKESRQIKMQWPCASVRAGDSKRQCRPTAADEWKCPVHCWRHQRWLATMRVQPEIVSSFNITGIPIFIYRLPEFSSGVVDATQTRIAVWHLHRAFFWKCYPLATKGKEH